MAYSEAHADSAVRDHLIAEAVDFRAMCSKTLEGHKIANGETVWQHLSHRVDALLDGRAVSFHRFELPTGHPMAAPNGGRPNDWLQIGEDDVVRVDDRPGFKPIAQVDRRI